MADAPAPRFLVSTPGRWADHLRDIAEREVDAGRGPGIAAALTEIDFRLRHEADEWGEGREYLPVLDIQLRVGIVGPVTVWYGVDAARRIVYVKRFRLRGDPP